MPLSHLEGCCRRKKNGTAKHSLVARLLGDIASTVGRKVKRNGSSNMVLILIQTPGH